VRARWPIIALIAIGLTWLLVPASVPMYDGVGTDQPYRYVHRPPGAKATPNATVAEASFKVTSATTTEAGYANSGEIGPQISVYVPSGAFRPHPGARRITIVATPLAPSSPLPSDGRIDGNVYRLTAFDDAGGLAVVGTGGSALTVQMRSTNSLSPQPVFERRTTAGWVQLKTLRVGQDIYQTNLTELADVALVRPRSAGHSRGGISLAVGLMGSGGVLLILAGLISFIRSGRRRAAEVPS
jgi:hypothetical protein